MLIRHGETDGNLARRYVGRTDEPLAHVGKVSAVKSGIVPQVPFVYCSTLVRTVQTAAIKFPYARILCVRGLREMDFGDFEYKNAAELYSDPRYRAWTDGGCLGETPHGEGRVAFASRVCVAFSEIVSECLARRSPYCVIVAHGGVIMSVMERFARPRREYFDWRVPPCGGYIARLDDAAWGRNPVLFDAEELREIRN
ncbi:MAG: histidine phosphatase family protein [Oscillospiraceae bacterium]|jgi:alpha-ribazole phosphatase|nr:histidine phosphatase family protein [Oscillospiraceae bacterium]